MLVCHVQPSTLIVTFVPSKVHVPDVNRTMRWKALPPALSAKKIRFFPMMPHLVWSAQVLTRTVTLALLRIFVRAVLKGILL